MIVKYKRANSDDQYDLKVVLKDNKSFVMTVAGNLDLYWIPDMHIKDLKFEISKNDDLLYNIFSELFDSIRKNDCEFNPSVIGDSFYFISEDYPEEQANKLKITKSSDKIGIEFFKNQDKNRWGGISRGCPICFCNSGSRVPKIEQLFMNMFLKLAYENNQIQVIER